MKAMGIITVITSIIVLVLSLVAFGKVIYEHAYEKGFNACIEENNLYERYGE